MHLKRTPQALFARLPRPERVEPNVIALRIQPDEGITISFDAKLPGTVMRTDTVPMSFCYASAFGGGLAAAYETLLLDAMQGDATLFRAVMRSEAEWKCSPDRRRLAKQTPPSFPNYARAATVPPPPPNCLPANITAAHHRRGPRRLRNLSARPRASGKWIKSSLKPDSPPPP